MTPRPAVLNCTPKCVCGEPKQPERQWCDACWDAMPASVAKRFSQAAQEVKAAIVRGDKSLKAAIIAKSSASLFLPKNVKTP